MTVYSPGDYVQAATELVQELGRAVRVRRLYDPDHPQRREVEVNALERIGQLLDAHGTIELQVEEDALKVDDRVVQPAMPGSESLPQTIHREGIRQLTFYSGLTLQEFAGFLENLVRASRPDADADEQGLVGHLWEEHFYHLRYTFVEHLQDEEWTPPAADRVAAGETDEERPPIRLAAEDRVEDEATMIVAAEFDTSLYFLDDEDMATLQAELEAEKSRALVHECLTCLRELLMDPVGDDSTPVLSALADMHARLVQEGDFGDVQKLHQLFIPYLESNVAGEAEKRVFREMRALALAPETLARLEARIDAGVVDEHVVAAYYRAFGREDPLALFARVGDLKKLFQRRAIAGALIELGRERLEALIEALASDDPRTAAAAAFLAGQLADARLVDGLGAALGADDVAVRREAIQSLKHFDGARALEHVASAVDDPDPRVRLYALRHLVAHRYAPAFPRVAALVESERWRERSPTEQRLLFEAYGALGGEGVSEELGRRIRPRGLFRKTDPEEVACALVGLGAVGTDRARAIVQQATTSRLPLVSKTALQVLDDWGRAVTSAGG